MKILSLLLLVLLSSCGTLRKLKSNVKTTEQVHTTEVITNAKDSSTSTVTKQIDSSGTTVTVVFDDNGKDTSTSVEIVTYPAHKEDYFSPRTTEVKTNRKPKSITINQAAKKEDKKEVAAAVKSNDTKAATTDSNKTTEEKKVDKKKSTFPWWFWPLIVVVILVLVLCWYYKITPANALAWLRKKLTKNNNMKSFIILIVLSSLMVGCLAPDKNKTKVEERKSLMRIDTFTNGAIAYNPIDWEETLVDTTAQHAYLGVNEKGQGTWLRKDSSWKKTKVIPRSVFWLTMPKKMVKHFMVVSDYFTEAFIWATVLSLLVVFAAYIFFRDDLVRLAGKGAVGIYFVVAIAVPFRMYQKRPSELADNNVKQLSRAEYDYWLKKDSTFESYWKEKWDRNELSGLTNKEVVNR
ncbi:MAG TPA: hypothetical protein VK173_05835 [Lacibacter sp.]|nr:hypothetical protein [Lacibacter sp.]